MARPLAVALAIALGAGIAIGASALGIRPLKITSGSMSPTVEPGDWIVVRDVDDVRRAGVGRGDVVVFRFPFGSSGRAVKRVVAIPGDRVELADGRVTINGRAIPTGESPGIGSPQPGALTIRPGHLFLLGDNAPSSIDSRSFGPIPARELVARQVLVLGPPVRLIAGALALLALVGGVLWLRRGRRE